MELFQDNTAVMDVKKQFQLLLQNAGKVNFYCSTKCHLMACEIYLKLDFRQYPAIHTNYS